MKKFIIPISCILFLALTLITQTDISNTREITSLKGKISSACYRMLDYINDKKDPMDFGVIDPKEVSSLSEIALLFRNKNIKNYKHQARKEILTESELAKKFDLSDIDPKDFVPQSFEGRHEALSRFLTYTYFAIKMTNNDPRHDHDYLASLLSLDIDYLRRVELVKLLRSGGYIKEELLTVFEMVYIDKIREIRNENYGSVIDRVANLTKIYTSPYPKNYISRITSPIEFFESFARAYDFQNFSNSWAHQISISPFAKRMKITKQEIKTILKLISQTDKRSEIEGIIADVIPVFNKKELKSFSLYDKEPFRNDPLNQCGWGSCWTFSSNTYFELLTKSLKGNTQKLNPDYSYIMAYISRALKYVINGTKVEEGGTFTNYLNGVKTVGLMPADAFEANIGYKASLQNKAEIKNSIAALKKRYKNELRDVTSEDELNKLRLKYLSEIKKVVFQVTGMPPKDFQVDGKTYTPKAFATHLGITDEFSFKTVNHLGDYPTLKDKDKENKKALMKKVSELFKYRLKMRGINPEDPAPTLKAVKASIDQGRPVLISHYTARGDFFDDGQIQSFRNGLNFIAPKRGSLNVTSSHQQVIVGYSLDKNGDISGLKVQNSWGKEMGQSGVFFMDLNYFTRFTKKLVFAVPPKEITYPAPANDEVL